MPSQLIADYNVVASICVAVCLAVQFSWVRLSMEKLAVKLVKEIQQCKRQIELAQELIRRWRKRQVDEVDVTKIAEVSKAAKKMVTYIETLEKAKKGTEEKKEALLKELHSIRTKITAPIGALLIIFLFASAMRPDFKVSIPIPVLGSYLLPLSFVIIVCLLYFIGKKWPEKKLKNFTDYSTEVHDDIKTMKDELIATQASFSDNGQ